MHLNTHKIETNNMKRLSAFFLTTLLIQTASAEVTFFNKSSQRNLEVTYQYCYYNLQTYEKTCTTAETSMINSNSSGQKNYLTVQLPQKFPVPLTAPPYIKVLSANEKDMRGNIVAQGHYYIDDCKYQVQESDDTFVNVGIEFDDNQSPIILCRVSTY